MTKLNFQQPYSSLQFHMILQKSYLYTDLQKHLLILSIFKKSVVLLNIFVVILCDINIFVSSCDFFSPEFLNKKIKR